MLRQDGPRPVELAEESHAANFSGLLTPDQQRRMAGSIRGEAAAGLIGTGFYALLSGLFLLFELWARPSGASASVYLQLGGMFLLSLVGVFYFYTRRHRLLAEVLEGRLEQASGHVAWKKGMYRAEVPGRILNVSGFNLGIGTYNFSYLPGSGRVVAAELAGTDTPSQLQAELHHALAVTNHFNEDDLSAFRQGRPGPRTFRWLLRPWFSFACLLAAPVLTAGFLYVLSALTFDQKTKWGLIIWLAAMIAWWLGVRGDGLGAFSRTVDLLRGQIVSVRGAVYKTIHHTHGRWAKTDYYYTMDGQKWLVSVAAYRALIEGQQYRVYYLPRSKQLVGIEPIADGRS